MVADGFLPKGTTLRSSKYLNNQVEQDHCGVKLRMAPMLGFKRFDTAAITIAGIELLRRIHKDQFNLGKLRLKTAMRLRCRMRCLQLGKARLGGDSCCLGFSLHQSP